MHRNNFPLFKATISRPHLLRGEAAALGWQRCEHTALLVPGELQQSSEPPHPAPPGAQGDLVGPQGLKGRTDQRLTANPTNRPSQKRDEQLLAQTEQLLKSLSQAVAAIWYGQPKAPFQNNRKRCKRDITLLHCTDRGKKQKRTEHALR